MPVYTLHLWSLTLSVQALTLIHASSGVARTRELATAHAEKAREVLQMLPQSDARDALEALTEGVVRRGW